MNLNRKAYLSAASLPLIAFSAFLGAAEQQPQKPCATDPCCAPTPPAPCYSVDNCVTCDYCLGPENIAGNPAVRPYTCNGDFVINVAGFYWNAHQDGLEYAIDTAVTTSASNNQVNIIDGDYLKPKARWQFGFKLGVGYNSTCDGWDFDLLWTHYRGRASNSDDVSGNVNRSIVPFWSAFQNPTANNQLVATNVSSTWKLKLDLVDFELGREFWNSKYLTIRPFVGLRYASINQDFDLNFGGGSWNAGQNPLNGEASMSNDFKGIGVRAGLNTVWHFCRGFSLFGNGAYSIIYGRFSVDQNEDVRLAAAPFTKSPVLSSDNGFRSSKGILDLELGLSWGTMFCDCQYGFNIGLSWENHLFFNQNQLWKVVRIGQSSAANSGSNVFNQSQGDLSTQGWTLNLRFDF